MILCDYCGGFYRYDCVNVNEELVRKTDLYKCPDECVWKMSMIQCTTKVCMSNIACTPKQQNFKHNTDTTRESSC